MKTASIKEIKTELEHLGQKDLLAVSLRLAKFKKENKELLSYLLFEASDEQQYIKNVQGLLHTQFTEVNVKNLYFTRKNLRKIIRTANRYLKYTDEKSTAIEILIYVCHEIRDLKIDIHKSTVISNLYASLIKKIKKLVSELHEDLQYDYHKAIDQL